MEDTNKLPRKDFTQDVDFTDKSRYLYTAAGVRAFKAMYKTDYAGLREIANNPLFQYIPQFARYPKANDVNNATIVNLFHVITEMRSLRLKRISEEIVEAKRTGNDTQRKALKESLPYITHSGIFIPRNNASLILPGFTYQLDIDKIDNADEVIKQILKDKHLQVLILSKSASGNGVKGILFLPSLMYVSDVWRHEDYKSAYHQVTDILHDHFQSKYGIPIDTQMKAISQPLFLFYAPNLYVNPNYVQWI